MGGNAVRTVRLQGCQVFACFCERVRDTHHFFPIGVGIYVCFLLGLRSPLRLVLALLLCTRPTTPMILDLQRASIP
jgi:hypothetical protein